MDRFWTNLTNLTIKWIDIEDRDFFRDVPYELTYDEFNKLLDEHDYEPWIPIHCKLNNISENAYRTILWERYCGKSVWDTRFKR